MRLPYYRARKQYRRSLIRQHKCKYDRSLQQLQLSGYMGAARRLAELRCERAASKARWLNTASYKATLEYMRQVRPLSLSYRTVLCTS